jgi:diguanylate cyclase (GGDEF)-like protein
MLAAAEPEADQTVTDFDHTGSDLDPTASDTPATGVLPSVHDASRAERLQSHINRAETSLARARTAAERFETAARRDETARLRDLAATSRDRAAAERDRAEELAVGLPDRPHGPEVQINAAAAARARAATDREQAARDREAAAHDREQAARDREAARVDLERAHLDDLTGAYRRSIGSVALQHEIDRASRSGRELTLAFVDVDGLKQVNDRRGHAAGDSLLRDVTAAIRSNLRSYDPVVRFGGDEFVCALSDTGMEAGRRRFDEIRRELTRTHPDASISVGLAALNAGESLDELLARGDKALYEARSGG